MTRGTVHRSRVRAVGIAAWPLSDRPILGQMGRPVASATHTSHRSRWTKREATIGSFVDTVLDFVRNHQAWAAPIVFVLAFGESLAFISLLLPATAILFATGGLIGAAGIPFWPIWSAAAVGAFLGDWVSYWFGIHYHRQIAHMWPLSRNPQMLERGEAFFRRWGTASVFFGRFFGPLRCVMPLVAGICEMPKLAFQVANVTSAIVWATGILLPGAFGMAWLR